MSPALQVVIYTTAIVCFGLATAGVTATRRPVHFGWLGVALVTLVLLAGAFEAL